MNSNNSHRLTTKKLTMALLPLCIGLSTSISAVSKNSSSLQEILQPQNSIESLNQIQQSSEVKIAERKNVAISLNLNNALTSTLNGGEVKVVSQKIQIPNAGLIKPHFSRFDIPEGAYVTVSNKSGTESYRYSKDNKDDLTYDLDAGDDGQKSFSSLSISGDTAVIRLHIPAGTNWQPHHAVEVDSYLEGYSAEKIQAALNSQYSTCGIEQREDAVCYADSHPTEFERSKAVAKLFTGKGSVCTAWRVGNENRMFTNNHCDKTDSEIKSSESWFNYQRTTCGGSTNQSNITKVSGASMLKTNSTLDYTLYTVNNFSSLSSFGNLGLDPRSLTVGEEIYIPQHGSGNPKELAIESDKNSGNVCRIDQAVTNGSGTNTDAGYKCDTIGGSSGSPVLARSSHKVVALHHLGNSTSCTTVLNRGALISKIWPQVSSFFPNGVPDGSGDPGGNKVPVADFSVSTNQLTASFTDKSSDPDGSVVSHAWKFGDNGTSSTANPTHTYSSSGTYKVTLTVTDNEGATNTTNKNVTVSDGTDPNALQNGVPVTGLSATKGNDLVYTMQVPSGAKGIQFNISGGTGDADMYVKFGAKPTDTSYDCRPYKNGNTESCTGSQSGGTYYIRVKAYSNFSGVSLVGKFTDGSTGNDPINRTENIASVAQGAWVRFTQVLPAGYADLKVTISGGTGDADLYVRKGAASTTTSYDCRPYKNGNTENCDFTNPGADTWHIDVRGYRASSGVTLNIKATPAQ
ncbi:pre-peptidase C-terminal domain-containing protein [Aliikangiella sp. IMCC44359]|uniref:pre-peptidase C-terminal domain-containing protein n=1 Tax=Aliikangiella sp. IMCC44359 TaxID=3459125 RepID=UPI00403AC10D